MTPRIALFALVAAGCGAVTVDPDATAAADARPDGSAAADAGADALSVDAAGGAADAGVASCDRADDDLVACFAFEPGPQPAVLVDGSAAGNSGSIAGVAFEAGVVGLAAVLDPATSRINVPESASLDVGEMTVSLWVRADAVVADAARQVLIDHDGQHVLSLQPGNLVTCSVRDIAGTLVTATTTVPVAIATWTHVACSYGTTSRSLTIFLDGAAVTSVVHAGAAASVAGEGGLQFGANSPCRAIPCTDAFDGSFDEIRVWQRALERAELCARAGLDC